MIAQMPERPAFVQFEMRAEEDREASIREGRYVAKDVEYAIITPPGGSLTVEKRAAEWLRSKQHDQHYPIYERAYQAWKQGQEEPVNGLSVKMLPFLSPAQIKMLLQNNIRTAEDLAALNEAGLARLGMGARALQQKTQAWLQSANDQGKLAEQIAALSVQVQQLTETLAQKDADIAALKAQLPEEDRPRRRRKAEDEAA